MIRFAVSLFAVLLLAAVLPTPAVAQETAHTCVGFIDTVPATITTQGVWCLRQDLATNMTSGNAIAIAANNVTIACNQYKLGGLSAGPNTQAIGIRTMNGVTYNNVTIRGCNIRGFFYGTRLQGSGQLVEDSRFDSNVSAGIFIEGDTFTVRRNLVLATSVIGIRVAGTGDVLDNSVAGLLSGISALYGIQAVSGEEGSIAINGNRVRGLNPAAPIKFGIGYEGFGRVTLRGNDVVGPGQGNGLFCGPGTSPGIARDNSISGFGAAAITGCTNATGNVIAP